MDNMKNFFIFLSGFIVGMLTLVIIGVCLQEEDSSETDSSSLPGATFFEEPGNTICESTFKIYQVLVPGCALAYEDKDDIFYLGERSLFLIIAGERKDFYDGMRVKMPKNKCLKQIGVYSYDSKAEVQMTVPIVKFMDK